jgi:RNA recognition motif-containing protein
MVKLLFCGDVGGNWKLLSDRLDDLQNSQHGPFDALFLTGRCFSSEEELSTLSTKVAFPIKTYCFDAPSYATKYELPSNMEIVGMGNRCGIVTLQHNLTVAYQMGKAGEEGSNGNANLDLVKQITASVGYRGCDICITSEWPKEMHHFLEPAELTEFKSTNIGIGAGSKAAASFAMLTRPRYHFVSGMGVFYQRSPYRNPVVNNGAVLGSNASTRLLAVCHVSATKEKTKKWLHALSVRPIIHLSAAELSEAPAGTTDCPYADVGVAAPLPPQPFASSSDGSFRNPFVSGATSLPSDEQAAKRARIDGPGGAGGFVPPPPAGPPPATGSFFFGNMGVPRGPAGAKQVNLTAPSDAACTLFIGGLMRSMQDSDLESALQGVRFIRRPPGKAFAFVEFVSHEAAKNVVDQAARRGLNVQGRTLTVGWAKGKEEDGRAGGENDRAAAQEPQLVPPSEDAKTLFIAGLTAFDASPDAVQPEGTDEHPLKIALDKLFPGVVSVNKPAGKSYAFVEFENYDAAMAVVTKSIQEPRSLTLQGTALVIGWAKGDGASGESRSRLVLDPPSATSQVLFVGNIPADATEEQISGLFPGCNITAVKRPQGREYAFVEFTTPADAQQAMSLSAGGEMQMGEHVLLVGWAKGRAAEKSDQSSECWFCLASAVVKVIFARCFKTSTESMGTNTCLSNRFFDALVGAPNC